MNDAVDLRRLHVLRMIDAHGTVTAAAAALHLTPSAVSHQMRQLAREVGIGLLEPHGRGVRLTAAGRSLVQHADALQAGWERAKADLAAHGDGPTGPVRLVGFSTVVAGLLAPAAAALRESRPQLKVQVFEVEGSMDGFELLLSGDADVAIAVPLSEAPPLDDTRFDQQPLLTEPLDLLVSCDHPLKTAVDVTLADAAGEPWIVSGPGPCDLRPMALAACAAAGFSPRIAHHGKTNVGLAALVGRGFGVTLMPRLAPLPEYPPVARIPLAGDPPPSRRLLSAVRRGSEGQPHVALALDAIRTVAQSLPSVQMAGRPAE
jgi:DNA-binding transcriptional LysR family regulator